MTKEEKIKKFDPNGLVQNQNLFGLPFSEEESELIVLPIPWELTVSYSSGTAKGPEAVKEASWQVDLFDPFYPDSWKHGIFLNPESPSIKNESLRLREKAEDYLYELTKGNTSYESLKTINKACEKMVNEVELLCLELLNKGKKIILLGGDHSCPLGFIKALAKQNHHFGILQIDAHADLRDAYEGFEYSHASIMYNALKIKEVEQLVQVGIRDYCLEEYDRVRNSKGRIVSFYDRDLKHENYKGISWESQCDRIISNLPEKVYVSFDIDGLDPKLCPNTGTPVAGGFESEEVLFLLEKLVLSGRKIIGMDLNEIAPGEDEWDANVGARVLYRMCNLMNFRLEES